MNVETATSRIAAGDDHARETGIADYHGLDDDARTQFLDTLGADAAAGNKNSLRALIELIDRHRIDRPAIRRILVRDEEVEEAHQDVLVALAQSINRYRGESTFATWFFSVARNTAASNLRRSQRVPEPVETTEVPMTGQRLSSMISSRTDLQAAVAGLPEHYREVVLLRDVEQLPYHEIADQLDIPMNTVKSRINRGRALVATALSEAT